MEIILDSKVFSRDGIIKCLYWYGDKFDCTLKLDSQNNFVVGLNGKPGSLNQIVEEELIAQFHNDVIDFQLRDIVSKETKNIRDILIAKAFSHGQFDSPPPGDITDPVGFDIGEIDNV